MMYWFGFACGFACCFSVFCGSITGFIMISIAADRRDRLESERRRQAGFQTDPRWSAEILRWPR